MGLTGTTSWTRNANTNTTTNIETYNTYGDLVSSPRENSSYWFVYRYYQNLGPVEYKFEKCVCTITTDASGCSSLSFSCSDCEIDPPNKIYWKVTASKTLDTDSMTECSLSGSTLSGTLSVKLLPNTTYYVLFYAVQAGNWCSAQMRGTLTITGSGTYGKPGEISANNANFGSAVSMSYASATSGATYTVKVKVGTSAEVTLQTKSSTSSRSWTPAVATYAPSYTNVKTVSCLITVDTYFGNTLAGTKTKTITLTFTAATVGPSLSGSAFSIAPYNTGAVSGKSGYIQGYSKIRATFASSGVTLKHGATVSKWTVKFGSAAAVDVAAGTTTKDSAVISATTSVVCTVTDSRGFTASTTLTATITPYAKPTLTASAFRCNSGGTASETGTYVSVTCSAKYESVSGQNTMSVSLYKKLASSSSWGSAISITGGSTSTSGTKKTYSRSAFLNSGLTDAVWDIKIVATDALGNTATVTVTLPSQVWALHLRNKGKGAAFGKTAERDNELDIGGWKITCGAISSLIDIEFASFSSLPKTVNNAAITANHKVIRHELGTPSAQTGDWTVTTADGSLTISGSISGTTTLRLILAIPGTTVTG